jgi:hypothetical protein
MERSTMGEFATYRGNEIKIGTAEDLLYLRVDQWNLITLSPGCDRQAYLRESRFRFPWPDEDTIEPGGFRDPDRSCPIPDLKPPQAIQNDHGRVQFTSTAGYLCSVPCPEGGVDLSVLRIQRNGFQGAVRLCQQRLWKGLLVGVACCNGCGLAWRLETVEDAERVAVALRSQADRIQDARPEWLHAVADRLLAGYDPAGPAQVLT